MYARDGSHSVGGINETTTTMYPTQPNADSQPIGAGSTGAFPSTTEA